MIEVSKPLRCARFTGDEVKKSSVLNSGVTAADVYEKICKNREKNKANRMKAQKKY